MLIADVNATQERRQAAAARRNDLLRRLNELANLDDASLAQRALARAERAEAAEQLEAVDQEMGEARIAGLQAERELQRALDHLSVPAGILKSFPRDVKRGEELLAAARERKEAIDARRQALARRGVVLAVANTSTDHLEEQIAGLHRRRDQAEKELEKRRAFWCGAGQARPEMAGNGRK